MKINDEYVTYFVDDEEPDCNRCENASNDKYCHDTCGPFHWWNGYCRSEKTEEHIDSKVRKENDYGNHDIILPEEKAGTGKPEEPPEEPGRNQGTV